jgi:hypothetical protein
VDFERLLTRPEGFGLGIAPLMNCRRCLDPRSGVRFVSAHSVNPTARTPHHASPKTGRFDRPDLRHGWIPCAYRRPAPCGFGFRPPELVDYLDDGR